VIGKAEAGRRIVAVRLVCLLPMLVLAACPSPDSDVSATIVDLPIAVVLGDGRVVIAGPDAREPLREWRADSAKIHQHGAHFLAQTKDARYVVALLPREDLASSTLMVVDLTEGTIRSRPLRDSGAVFTSLTIGPGSGLAYAVGSGTDGVVASTFAIPSLEPSTRRQGGVAAALQRPVYSAALDAEERRLYASFHEWTDWFTIEENSLTQCPAASRWRPNRCIGSHGILRVVSDGVVYATGGPLFYRTTANGSLDSIAIGLEGSHLMDFDIDSTNNRVVAVGSCGFAGRLATTSLTVTAEGSVGHPPSGLPTQRSVCGERISVEPRGRWAAVARRASPPYASRGPGAIVVVDTETGVVLRTIAVPAPPLDVIVLRGR